MAKIQSSRAKLYETRSTVADEPTEYVESAGDKFIKELVSKQLDTKINLNAQLREKKHFEKSTQYLPLTNLTSGESSLKEFEETAKKAALVEKLSSFGLSNEEVEMAVDYEVGEDYFSNKYSKIEKSALASRLLLIHSKIENGEKELAKELEKRLSVGRHEKELYLSVKPESLHTRLLQFALSCKSAASDPRPEGHPIHHLKELEQELFGNLKKKRCKEKAVLLERSTETPVSATPLYHYNYDHHSTLWDVKECPLQNEDSKVTFKRKKQKNETHLYTCKPETLYTIKDSKIVPISGLPKQKPDIREGESCAGQAFVVSNLDKGEMKTASFDDIQNNKLSLEQIKQLPRFQNYEKGSPSPVLYIKNLAGSVKETDLVLLFSCFESSEGKRIVYRLLTGKMKGQAFITFPSSEVATKALDAVNGYLLKGKPMIIEYGKSHSPG